MDKIAILTDTTSDLPLEIAEEKGIYIIPLYVNLGEKYYKDKFEISTEEVGKYNRENEKNPAQSSAPSPMDFKEIYKKIKEDGHNKILFISLGSKFSATYQIGEMIAEDMDIEIRLIDTKTATVGEGMLALFAKKLVDEGYSFHEVIEKVEEAKERTNVYGRFDTLKNIKASGRLSSTATKIATALNVKPLLNLTPKSGLEILKLKRSESKAKSDIIRKITDELKDVNNYYLTYIYSGDTTSVEEVSAEIKQLEDNALITFKTQIGSVVGVHVGEKMFGVGYLIID